MPRSGGVVGRHLDTGEDAPVRGAVIAVVEQADVPRVVQRFQKLQQRARTLGKLEAIQALVVRFGSATADHMPQVNDREFVVGQVEHIVARLFEVGDQARALIGAFELHTDEDLRVGARGVAIVELGDAAAADRATECLNEPGRSGMRHRQQCFAMFTKLGTLGDMAQPVEVHIRATGQGDQRSPWSSWWAA